MEKVQGGDTKLPKAMWGYPWHSPPGRHDSPETRVSLGPGLSPDPGCPDAVRRGWPQGDGLEGTDPQDLRAAQQVGLHSRARVSHSSMASGYKCQGSWRRRQATRLSVRGPQPHRAPWHWVGSPVLPGWQKLRLSPGSGSPVPRTVPATQPFIPSRALWAPSQKEGAGSLGSPKGAGQWGLFLGLLSAIPVPSGHGVLVVVAPWLQELFGMGQ